MPRDKTDPHQNELNRVVAELSQEARDNAPRIASDLFPKGPAGHQTLSHDQELDMIARHWHEKSFRTNLLERVAPPGPNGYPDPVLAQRFIDLYADAVLKRGSIEQDVPQTGDRLVSSLGEPPSPGSPDPAMREQALDPMNPMGMQAPMPQDVTTPPAQPGPTQVTPPLAPQAPPGAPVQPPAETPQLPQGMPPPPEFPF